MSKNIKRISEHAQGNPLILEVMNSVTIGGMTYKEALESVLLMAARNLTSEKQDKIFEAEYSNCFPELNRVQ